MSIELDDVPVGFRSAVLATLETVGVKTGHLAVEAVSGEKIRELNREFRDRDQPTDVLSFPVDEDDSGPGPRELGDVFFCPEHCVNETEAVIHGVLHLCGHDHGTDSGEMLDLQDRIVTGLGLQPSMTVDAESEEPNAHPDQLAAGESEAGTTRSGFVGLAGRPNVGKSTLVNALVGAKVAITSVRPQTTRRAIRGVATDLEAGSQLVLVDLPGVQRPRDELTSRMQSRVEHELAGADVVLLVVNGQEGVGPGDRFIASYLLGSNPDLNVVCVVNKADLIGRDIVPVLIEAAALEGVSEVFPVSALTGDGVPELAAHLGGLMPESPYLYPPGDRSDQPRELLLAELIRGVALVRTRDEIPHSVEVKVTGIEQREDGLWFVDAEIWVESDSQKGILIGKKGFKVGEIGTDARKDLETELGDRVHLDLKVRVRHRWRRDEDMLDRLGID